MWLSTDSQYGKYTAVSAWLNQYHNPMFLGHPAMLDTKLFDVTHEPDVITEKAEFMDFKRAGAMAAALIFMYAEASNGQMPNLDLLNVVHYLAVHRQGFRVNIEKINSLLSSVWLRVIAEVIQTLGSLWRKINPDWKLDIKAPDYVEGTANLASSMYNQLIEHCSFHFILSNASFSTVLIPSC